MRGDEEEGGAEREREGRPPRQAAEGVEQGGASRGRHRREGSGAIGSSDRHHHEEEEGEEPTRRARTAGFGSQVRQTLKQAVRTTALGTGGRRGHLLGQAMELVEARAGKAQAERDRGLMDKVSH